MGIGPIKEESLVYFYRITADYKEAKIMAAAELLLGYLKYDHKDMVDLDIMDTRKSGKDDDILYIVMDDPANIRDIRRRISYCNNPVIKTPNCSLAQSATSK